jgi:hypothetical protein
VLLPDEPGARPVEFVGEVVRVAGERVWVRRVEPTVGAPGDVRRAGQLFTGTNGPHCPAALWIGRVAPSAHDLGEIEVATPMRRGGRAVEYHSGRSPR